MNTLSIKMTPAGVELVIAALRELPHKQVHDLVSDIWSQYTLAMTPPPPPEPEPVLDDGCAAAD